MSVIAVTSQLNTGSVLAAPEDEIEIEDTTGTESDAIPPEDLKWVAPGKFSFKFATDESMWYNMGLARYGEDPLISLSGLLYPSDSAKYQSGDIYTVNCGDFFMASGLYRIVISVSRTDAKGDWVDSESADLFWECPEDHIATPANLHWEKTEIVCDPVKNASAYHFVLYQDGEYQAELNSNENRVNFYKYLNQSDKHAYQASVIAVSADLTKYANSEPSEMSAAYAKESSVPKDSDEPKEENTPKDGNESKEENTPKDGNESKEENTPKDGNEQSQTGIPKDSYPRLITGTDGKERVYKKGVEIARYTGLAILGATGKTPWVYVKDGKRVYDYIGYVEYEKSLFYVEKGIWQEDLNGVMVDPNSEPLVWYFNANGQVQSQHTGLAEYDSEWFYIENGKVATDMNAFVEYDGGLFAVGAGRIIREYSGLMQDPQDPVNGAWYFFADGQAQTQYTGLAQYDNAWFYIVDGKLATEYTGSVEHDGTVFNVVNGMVR